LTQVGRQPGLSKGKIKVPLFNALTPTAADSLLSRYAKKGVASVDLLMAR